MTESEPPRRRLLVSYFPEDQALKDQLLRHLKAPVRFAGIEVWSVDQVGPGGDWQRAVGAALGEADTVVLLISAGFLSSDLLQNVEMPKLMEERKRRRLRLVPVLLRSCHWECVPWLQTLAMLPKSGKAVAAFDDDARDGVLAEVAKEIVRLSSAPVEQGSVPRLELARGHELKADPRAAPVHQPLKSFEPERLAGTTFPGDYVAEQKVASVGMSVVYRARRMTTSQTVLVRVFRPRVFEDALALASFEKWTDALRRIKHGNCARIIDTGIHDCMPYLMTEDVRGRFLVRLFEANEVLAPMEAAVLVRQILEALAEVHRAGLIHGTLCPSDIVVAPHRRGDRWATLLDFGVPESISDGGGDRLARLKFLVPGYAAPEQYSGFGDARVDLYACGVILFQAISGRRPFGGLSLGKTIADDAVRSVNFGALREDVQKRFARILMRALEAEPTERFQLATDFANALREWPTTLRVPE